MDNGFDIKKFEEKMKKCIENLQKEFVLIRAGRANPAILNKVRVEYYGSLTPIEQIAAVSVSEARVLVISPWDVSSLSLIEKAIQQSDIGINPINDGKVLRIVFPQLTKESRQQIVKEIHKLKENAKITDRNIRKDALDEEKKKKKDKVLNEDDVSVKEKEIKKLVDTYNDKIDSASQKKEKEVMEVWIGILQEQKP